MVASIAGCHIGHVQMAAEGRTSKNSWTGAKGKRANPDDVSWSKGMNGRGLSDIKKTEKELRE